MPQISITEKIARKVLPVIYVLDVSGNMGKRSRIEALNQAMNTTICILKKMETNYAFKTKISILTFASGAKWVTNGLEDPEDITWSGVHAGGLADLGAALKELNKKMSRKELFQSDEGFKVPILIFFSSVMPTDDYEGALEDIKKSNKWFEASIKIAIALGEHADISILTKVVDNNPETVISVDDAEMLESLIPEITSIT